MEYIEKAREEYKELFESVSIMNDAYKAVEDKYNRINITLDNLKNMLEEANDYYFLIAKKYS